MNKQTSIYNTRRNRLNEKAYIVQKKRNDEDIGRRYPLDIFHCFPNLSPTRARVSALNLIVIQRRRRRTIEIYTYKKKKRAPKNNVIYIWIYINEERLMLRKGRKENFVCFANIQH